MRTGIIPQLIAALIHRLDVWKAREDLRRLDDRLLSDIGLRRSEIDRVVDGTSLARSRGLTLIRRPLPIRGVAAQ
ncbi:MAG: DUF1127 domain-containing protein [Rhodospirillum sp.]|nr:DUF1127 domain-containing protein [Rhodospirillum sp.]MCF8490339.1 DUF1127 domain-containing protein [Rhodospirillum sp.]MCF8501821.1 DUF1127 domain-containing protein [Rhodospirillum sp.]